MNPICFDRPTVWRPPSMEPFVLGQYPVEFVVWVWMVHREVRGELWKTLF